MFSNLTFKKLPGTKRAAEAIDNSSAEYTYTTDDDDEATTTTTPKEPVMLPTAKYPAPATSARTAVAKNAAAPAAGAAAPATPGAAAPAAPPTAAAPAVVATAAPAAKAAAPAADPPPPPGRGSQGGQWLNRKQRRAQAHHEAGKPQASSTRFVQVVMCVRCDKAQPGAYCPRRMCGPCCRAVQGPPPCPQHGSGSASASSDTAHQ